MNSALYLLRTYLTLHTRRSFSFFNLALSVIITTQIRSGCMMPSLSLNHHFDIAAEIRVDKRHLKTPLKRRFIGLWVVHTQNLTITKIVALLSSWLHPHPSILIYLP